MIQTRGTLPPAFDGAKKTVMPSAPLPPKAPTARRVLKPQGRPPKGKLGPGLTGGVQHHTPIQGGYAVRKAMARAKARGL